jgi:hypothetical protein
MSTDELIKLYSGRTTVPSRVLEVAIPAAIDALYGSRDRGENMHEAGAAAAAAALQAVAWSDGDLEAYDIAELVLVRDALDGYYRSRLTIARRRDRREGGTHVEGSLGGFFEQAAKARAKTSRMLSRARKAAAA